MAITEVNRKKGKGKKAIKKILKKGNTCKNRQKGGKNEPPYIIKCNIVGEDGKEQRDNSVLFTPGTTQPDIQSKITQKMRQIEKDQKKIIEGLTQEIKEMQGRIENLQSGTAPGTSGTGAQSSNAASGNASDTAAQSSNAASGNASDTTPPPTDELNNEKSNVQQEQQKTIEIFNNKKMKSIILLKQAYILKLLVLKNNVKKGTFKIEYKANANANSQPIELTYLDMLSINGDDENFKKYIGDANANANATINKITLTIGTNIQKEFNTLQEIIEFLNALENFNLDGLFTTEEINFLNKSKVGGKKRKYRRAIKKALKQKSVKGCVKININEKNKKRKKTFNRKIKIRNGSLRKK